MKTDQNKSKYQFGAKHIFNYEQGLFLQVNLESSATLRYLIFSDSGINSPRRFRGHSPYNMFLFVKAIMVHLNKLLFSPSSTTHFVQMLTAYAIHTIHSTLCCPLWFRTHSIHISELTTQLRKKSKHLQQITYPFSKKRNFT